MIALALAARWAHLVLSIALVGAVVAPLLAGRSDRPTVRAWHARVTRLAGTLALLALLTGLVSFGIIVVVLEERLDALADGAALARVLLDTRGGVVWLVRAGLLLVLAAFLALRLDVTARLDWMAARGEAVLLSLAALAALAAAGHAAAVEPATMSAIAIDGIHLAAAGVWLGGLLPLALLLGAARRVEGEDGRAYAVLAARRFSRAAGLAVAVLVVTGVANASAHVGGVPALAGTPYGRLLLAKLLLVVPLLALGAVNRRRWLPALSGDAATIGRPVMRRLATFIAIETTLGVLLLLVVAAMTSTPPARHVDPAWPFTFRLSWDAIAETPAARTRVLVASQVAVVGAVAALAAAFVARARPALAGGGGALVVIGAALALPALSVDAYPTTYRRPAVPYTATSIAHGLALYGAHCARCHGPSGGGDGPDARTLPRPPADLRGRHTAQHTAGDLFWWIANGIPAAGMPAFGARLGDDQRWDLVNAVRAIAAGQSAQAIGPTVVPEAPAVVAPDFAFAVGPAAPRNLRDYRGQRIVLLVLYTLPGSRARLGQLADAHRLLGVLGADIVAVPTDAAPDAIARLGANPRVLFQIVTSGAEDIVAAYRPFALAPHAELLIDRQGYVRARWTAADGATREPNLLLAEIQQLNEEPAVAEPADEHVH
ncbi:MAG: CopD family protein [Candidatus Rokubacteria bacterium]|nr:CopD family protein [Candidatus Rokubacteria bacterium]